MSNYQETIAELRQAAANREIRDKEAEAESWLADVRACEKQAAEFAADGDRQNALISAQSANEAEIELNRVLAQIPVPQQQLSPAKQVFNYQHQDWLERGGPKAVELLGEIHNRALRPPNPGTNHPGYTGAGLSEDSPEYIKYTEDNLELYAPQLGLPRFNPEDRRPTLEEAAKICGVSVPEYERQRQRMYAEGRNTDSQYGQQWSRKVG